MRHYLFAVFFCVSAVACFAGELQGITEPIDEGNLHVGKHAKFGCSLTGGIAKALGQGSEQMTMGFDAGELLFCFISDGFGFGEEVRYNQWSIDGIPGASIRYFEILVTFLFGSITADIKLQVVFQPGIGYFHGRADASIPGKSIHASEGAPGISVAGGLVFFPFVIQPAFKIAFTKYSTDQWLDLNVGYFFCF
jgi:hypothetical protein